MVYLPKWNIQVTRPIVYKLPPETELAEILHECFKLDSMSA